jgi:NAD-dependent SIR2 family protein deacetylase
MQWLGNRLAQHGNDVKLGKKCTALCDHCVEKGHSFDFENTNIVWFEENEKKRKLREAIEIVKRPNTVNFKTDSDHVNAIYSPVLANRIARHNV